MKANPGEFTEAEKSTLKSAINQFARSQAEGAYVEFNKALRDKLIAHGITMIREAYGDISSADALKFSNVPCKWLK